jgi:uncharacterized protein
MSRSPLSRLALLILLAACLLAPPAVAQRGPGRGLGRGAGGPGGGAGGPGHGHDDRHEADHDVLHFLLENHKKIQRTVTHLENGVETLTESDDPQVAAKIKEHVRWMKWRIEETRPIRMRDPLFAELFRHTDSIEMNSEETAKGMRVTETSKDAYVAKLIQAHAAVVSKFVERGFAEAPKNHPVPEREGGPAAGESDHPVITSYGKIIPLPEAVQQPRDGSRLVVDLTRGGEPDKLNAAIEKLARYVNIYGGAGKVPADVQIRVVVHDDATLSVLKPDAYSAKFGTEGNPNLDCLRELHDAGVEFVVCGQSLVGKGHDPEEVVEFVKTAVSALTALVNDQADGYAYIPLLN